MTIADDEFLIYTETPEDEGHGKVWHYGLGDMREVFGPESTNRLAAGKVVWHKGGLAVNMRHAAQEALQAAFESGEFDE